MQFTEEHELIRETLRKFIDDEINPHVDEWEEAQMFPAHEVFKKLGDGGLPRRQQAGRVRRPRARLLVPDGDGRGARPHPLRRRPDGDRRADRHVHAGAGAPRLATSCAASSSRPRSPATWSAASASARRAPAPTWRRSRPPRARTATTTSSAARRCGSPTASRPTGCAASPTPARARRTTTSR